MRANFLPLKPHYYVPQPESTRLFLAAAVQKQQMDRDCKTLAFWRGDRYREEGSGEGIYPRNFGIFMTLANKSTKVGAPCFAGMEGREEKGSEGHGQKQGRKDC